MPRGIQRTVQRSGSNNIEGPGEGGVEGGGGGEVNFGRHLDCYAAGGEVGTGNPVADAVSRGRDDDGAGDFELDGVGGLDPDSGGDAAEGVGRGRGHVGDVVEGEDAMAEGEFRDGSGTGRERE